MDLRELEHERLRAIVLGDRKRLEALHHEDFRLCTPSGDIVDRAFYLSGVCDGSINYSRFEAVTPIEVVQAAGLGVVRYRSAIDISIQGRPVGHLECWHLDVYTQGDAEGWRCLWSQATDTLQGNQSPG